MIDLQIGLILNMLRIRNILRINGEEPMDISMKHQLVFLKLQCYR